LLTGKEIEMVKKAVTTEQVKDKFFEVMVEYYESELRVRELEKSLKEARDKEEQLRISYNIALTAVGKELSAILKAQRKT